MPATDVRFAFEGFVFDPATGELSGPPGTSRLPPKPARLLTLLLEHPQELVAREELAHELWPHQHVELDQSLSFAVRQVRAALGDDAGDPRFVETLPRRGYRFIGRVEVRRTRREVPVLRGAGSPPRTWPVVLAVLALAALAVAGWVDWAPPESAPQEAARSVRVALLPLYDPGADSVNARLTERLLVALTAGARLDVVGPASTAPYHGTERPHTEVGRELGVELVVSGGYRPSERVLFLQMIRVADGGHLFARRHRGSEEDVLEQLPDTAAALATAAIEGR